MRRSGASREDVSKFMHKHGHGGKKRKVKRKKRY
jgi:hypothetical protein